MRSLKPTVDLSRKREFNKFKDLLLESKKILISTHQLPDGDGLGAASALFHYLKKARKSCRIYNPDELPRRYQFLDPKNSFLHGPKEAEAWDSFDLWVIVDTNDPRRLGKLWSEFSLKAKRIVFLDHHPDIASVSSITYPPHALLVSDTKSSSIGELLYEVFKELDLTEFNHEVATGLYVSVMTDTNSFRYARTTPLAHTICGEMIELGVNPEEIYQNIYSSKELSHLHLLGTMLQNVKVSSDGKIAWLEMGLELRKKHHASADDTLSFLNLLLLLKNAEILCLFREEDDRRIRVSLKSKGRIVINHIAAEYGGGGHEFAAGFGITATLEKTVDSVTKRLEKLIKDSKNTFDT
jgi:phosphoesterase RecJ-like protein